MNPSAIRLDVGLIGGGMITRDLMLPSIYQLQREGAVGSIRICALNSAPLRALRDDPEWQAAFPGAGFEPYPDWDEDPQRMFPDLYRDLLEALPPRQLAVVAVPDAFHYDMVMAALRHDQHVLCVKPLVLRYRQAVEIEEEARRRGLFVGVEYHKRFDRRNLLARLRYRGGEVGAFTMGEAKLIEPYYYRHSNFQNWFTCDQTDPFVYVGCHYVDLVVFITGLRPVAVAVSGIKGTFPNGKEGYLWAHGKVRFENEALLSVINGLGYPDRAGGANDQSLVLYCSGEGEGGLIAHDDQFRGVEYATVGKPDAFGSSFRYVNPDFFRMVPWEGEGARPVGYGYDSIAANVQAVRSLEAASVAAGAKALAARRRRLAEIDAHGLIATPANSAYNELVQEAARASILHDGVWADIRYGPGAGVSLRG